MTKKINSECQFKKNRLLSFVFFGVLLIKPLFCDAQVDNHEKTDDVTYGSDPSEIISRLEFRNEYVALPEDGYLNSSIFRVDYAPNEFWMVRTEIPLVTGENYEFGSDFGLGDITLGARAKV